MYRRYCVWWWLRRLSILEGFTQGLRVRLLSAIEMKDGIAEWRLCSVVGTAVVDCSLRLEFAVGHISLMHAVLNLGGGLCGVGKSRSSSIARSGDWWQASRRAHTKQRSNSLAVPASNRARVIQR